MVLVLQPWTKFPADALAKPDGLLPDWLHGHLRHLAAAAHKMFSH